MELFPVSVLAPPVRPHPPRLAPREPSPGRESRRALPVGPRVRLGPRRVGRRLRPGLPLRRSASAMSKFVSGDTETRPPDLGDSRPAETRPGAILRRRARRHPATARRVQAREGLLRPQPRPRAEGLPAPPPFRPRQRTTRRRAGSRRKTAAYSKASSPARYSSSTWVSRTLRKSNSGRCCGSCRWARGGTCGSGWASRSGSAASAPKSSSRGRRSPRAKPGPRASARPASRPSCDRAAVVAARSPGPQDAAGLLALKQFAAAAEGFKDFPVHYPLTGRQRPGETTHFEWFRGQRGP